MHEWESEDMPVFEYVSGKGKQRRKPRLYGWGYAATGELGIKEFLCPTYHEAPLEYTHKPCIIPFGDKHPVSSVACGVGFSVFIAKGLTRNLPTAYGTGVNAYHQLGFHANDHFPEKGIQYLIEPKEVPLPLRFPDSTKVTHVGCGKAHTIVATDNEGVFSLGSNEYGQCGRPVIENEDYMRSSVCHKIDGLPADVNQVVCGMDHTIIVDGSGKVYAFGCGLHGQLERGALRKSFLPPFHNPM
uniref:Uncharacterized protein n=1 Tax=Trichuris muris TaxID=70415 RepID=A0A5S6Q2G9_TRIMR